MSAAWSTFTRPAMFAGQDCVKRMPFAMQPTMSVTAAPDRITSEADVLASVSLFVLVYVVSTLVRLVLLLSLTLSGPTGLRGMVGLPVRLDTNAARGN